MPVHGQQVDEDMRWGEEFGNDIGFNEGLQQIEASGPSVYARGTFLRAGGIFAEGMAHWDGQQWNAMQGGLCNFDDPIRQEAYCTFGRFWIVEDSVYVGARYKRSGDALSSRGLIKWDGDSWIEVIPWEGSPDYIADLLIDNGLFYMAGRFTHDPGDGTSVVTNGVVTWDGQSWTVLGDTDRNLFTGGVYFIGRAGGFLYAAGSFSSIDGVEAKNIARWNGSVWEPLPGTASIFEINTMHIHEDKVYLGGILKEIDGRSVPLGLAMWDGANWEILAPENIGALTTQNIEVIGSTIYLGGTYVGEGLGPSQNGGFTAIKFENGEWVPIKGMSRNARFADDLTEWAGELLVMGERSIDVLNEQGFRPVDDNNGLNSRVYDLAVDNGSLYVAGEFSAAGGEPSTGIARWDGERWHHYGNTFNGWVTHVTASDGIVYASGDLAADPYATEVNGQPISPIAMLKDDQWQPLPGSLESSFVFALEAYKGRLYVAGSFTEVDGIDTWGIAMWDGMQWNGFGTDYTFDFRIKDIALTDDFLYVGGDFKSGGDSPGTGIAKWNGTEWSAVGNDDFPEDVVFDLLYDRGALYVAGLDSIYRLTESKSWETVSAGNVAPRSGMVKGDSTLFLASLSGISTDPVEVKENCTIFGSNVVEVVGSVAHALGSGTLRCQPPDFFTQWGNDKLVRAVEIFNNHLYIGGDFTYAGGKPSNYIGKWSLAPVRTSIEPGIPARIEMDLERPYPNPFSHSVSARFTLSRSQAVRVEVFSVLGQRVAFLLDETVSAGTHDISWTPDQIPAGLYFMHLQSREARMVQKVVYIE